jgi:hypothetical protein
MKDNHVAPEFEKDGINSPFCQAVACQIWDSFR